MESVTERERETERETERERQRETDRQRETERQRERERGLIKTTDPIQCNERHNRRQSNDLQLYQIISLSAVGFDDPRLTASPSFFHGTVP